VLLALLAGTTTCPSAGFFGIPCPGCGLSRATKAALRGELAQAVALHPLVFVIAPLYGALMLLALASAVWGARFSQLPRWLDRWVTRGAVVLLVSSFSIWLARFAGAFGGPVPVRPWPGFGVAHWLAVTNEAQAPSPPRATEGLGPSASSAAAQPSPAQQPGHSPGPSAGQ
jgi:hypothetical protein